MAFASRIHIDVMDGLLAPTKSPSIREIWLPEDKRIDIHLMYQRPADYLEVVVALKPALLVVHAEAEGNFVEMSRLLRQNGIRAGIALLPQTEVEVIRPALEHIDHVLIFSGKLGYHGGHADLSMLTKVREVRQMKPGLEIAWDGGIDDQNAGSLIDSGVDVLNTGGFIQNAHHPASAYGILKQIAEKLI
jgi:ribulose-phosphate 3-epimerase